MAEEGSGSQGGLITCGRRSRLYHKGGGRATEVAIKKLQVLSEPTQWVSPLKQRSRGSL